ncbi:MAG: leucine-rich repeat domain-containing protein [Treponema sp.]|nr:leucine-rich repeat domain-containing protein [Treponema sp.]
MNGKWIQHGITVLAFASLIVLGLACATAAPYGQNAPSGQTAPSSQTASSQTTTGQSAAPQVQQQAAQPQAPASPYFTGDGGKGMSIAILPLQAAGLDEKTQGHLPSTAQGEFVANFRNYSAVSVLDRERLDDQYRELESGYYDINAGAGKDFGQLTPTTHIMGGKITRTATGYALQMQITKTADKMTTASYSGTFTFTELDNFTGIRRASLDLLQKMGVTLTARAQTELTGAAAENKIIAQTALARGIIAQRQGTEVAALSFYYQAAAYDPSLMEAANRSSILNVNISSSNIGDNIRNDSAWRDEWVARLRETEQFFDSFNRAQSMPYTLFYTSEIKQIGNTDYEKKTATLGGIETHLHGSGIWTVAIERAVQDIYDKLDATKRKENWGLASWPRQGVTSLNAFSNRSQNFSVVFELLNTQNKVIGRQTLQTGGSWGLNWSGRPTINVNADERKTLNFQNVNINDITDSMTIRVATINGTDAETAARNGVLQIQAMPRYQFNYNGQWRFARGEIQGFTNNAAKTANLVIPDNIWGDPVIFIGEGAFRNTELTSVTIPDSVISIGNSAFANNKLISVTIPKSVTSIGTNAFTGNRGSVDGFDFILADNGKSLSIVGYNGKAKQIPSQIQGTPVTRIEEGVFRNRKITSVTIPDSITYIGKEAFYEHKNGDSERSLTSITIGANVFMEHDAFKFSYKLSSEGTLSQGGDNSFVDFYIQNGRIADSYSYKKTNGMWYNNDGFPLPPSLIGTWKRDKYANTLTFTANSIINSHQPKRTWKLRGKSYAMYKFFLDGNETVLKIITINFINGDLVIMANRGLGRDKWWDGTWKKQ